MGGGSKLTSAKFKVTGRRKAGTVKNGILCGAEDRCNLWNFANKDEFLASFLIELCDLGQVISPEPQSASAPT